MIEFFEFMNSCSPLRTIVYLIFILILLYMGITAIGGITEMIIFRNVIEEDNDETTDEN